MYLEHWGLERSPFAQGDAPPLFYEGESQRRGAGPAAVRCAKHSAGDAHRGRARRGQVGASCGGLPTSAAAKGGRSRPSILAGVSVRELLWQLASEFSLVPRPDRRRSRAVSPNRRPDRRDATPAADGGRAARRRRPGGPRRAVATRAAAGPRRPIADGCRWCSTASRPASPGWAPSCSTRSTCGSISSRGPKPKRSATCSTPCWKPAATGRRSTTRRCRSLVHADRRRAAAGQPPGRPRAARRRGRRTGRGDAGIVEAAHEALSWHATASSPHEQAKRAPRRRMSVPYSPSDCFTRSSLRAARQLLIERFAIDPHAVQDFLAGALDRLGRSCGPGRDSARVFRCRGSPGRSA